MSRDKTDQVITQPESETDSPKETQTTIEKMARGHTEKTWREPVTGMEFVWVPEGCYEMGCGSWTGDCDKDGKPVHEVCVDGFWIAKYEVTLSQWRKIDKSGRPDIGKGNKHPAENISWYDAKEFIELLYDRSSDDSHFRLPTEAEWEYACRSGGKPEVYAGSNEIKAVAWYRENSDKTTHQVGTMEPNGLGIYDMSGNIREWCEDRYSVNAYSRHQRHNPMNKAGSSRRVIRGGSWKTVAFHCRSTSRYRLNPDDRRSGVGFRIIRIEAKEKQKAVESVKKPIRNVGTVKVYIGNIRKGPSKDYEIIATMKKGDTVTVIRQEDKWYYIRLSNGRLGWCHQSLLTIPHQ